MRRVSRPNGEFSFSVSNKIREDVLMVFSFFFEAFIIKFMNLVFFFLDKSHLGDSDVKNQGTMRSNVTTDKLSCIILQLFKKYAMSATVACPGGV